MRPPLVTPLIIVIGIVVWLALLSWLTAGQPFSWFGPDPSCVAPADSLACDQRPTPAEQVYQQGWSAFAVATPAAGLVVAVLQLSRMSMRQKSA